MNRVKKRLMKSHMRKRRPPPPPPPQPNEGRKSKKRRRRRKSSQERPQDSLLAWASMVEEVDDLQREEARSSRDSGGEARVFSELVASAKRRLAEEEGLRSMERRIPLPLLEEKEGDDIGKESFKKRRKRPRPRRKKRDRPW